MIVMTFSFYGLEELCRQCDATISQYILSICLGYKVCDRFQPSECTSKIGDGAFAFILTNSLDAWDASTNLLPWLRCNNDFFQRRLNLEISYFVVAFSEYMNFSNDESDQRFLSLSLCQTRDFSRSRSHSLQIIPGSQFPRLLNPTGTGLVSAPTLDCPRVFLALVYFAKECS